MQSVKCGTSHQFASSQLSQWLAGVKIAFDIPYNFWDVNFGIDLYHIVKLWIANQLLIAWPMDTYVNANQLQRL